MTRSGKVVQVEEWGPAARHVVAWAGKMVVGPAGPLLDRWWTGWLLVAAIELEPAGRGG